MTNTLVNPKSIRFTVRRRDGYGDVTDYNAIVDDVWTGIVFRCLYVAPRPGARLDLNSTVCKCGKWHANIAGIGKGVSMPGHPNVNVFGFSTRNDAARAIAGIRAAWDLVRPAVSSDGPVATPSARS